jgi:predicted alpha/beta-hydrolase family hydrolase
VKSVFVHGTNDAFGTSEEMRTATAAIPTETMIVEVTGAGHDLRGGSLDWSAVLGALEKLIAF